MKFYLAHLTCLLSALSDLLHFIRVKKGKALASLLCPAVCEPMDCSPPGFSIHGILQETILEWIAIPFSRRSSQSRDQAWVS